MGAAIAARGITLGMNPYAATLLALIGVWQQAWQPDCACSIKNSGIAFWNPDYDRSWSINLRIMGKANISLLRMNTVYTLLENSGLDKAYAIIILGLIAVLA